MYPANGRSIALAKVLSRAIAVHPELAGYRNAHIADLQQQFRVAIQNEVQNGRGRPARTRNPRGGAQLIRTSRC